jgi:hypothetical protein
MKSEGNGIASLLAVEQVMSDVRLARTALVFNRLGTHDETSDGKASQDRVPQKLNLLRAPDKTALERRHTRLNSIAGFIEIPCGNVL